MRTNPDLMTLRDVPVRILLYSHDSFGLGHLRRTLNIATALTRSFRRASALIVSGSPSVTQFRCRERVEVVKLPSVTKTSQGAYNVRTLGVDYPDLMQLRTRLILESFRAFHPTLVIVDHQVIGLNGEVLPLLREARDLGVRTILGLRDIVDDPEVVDREWSSSEHRWALTEGYDQVCVYGDPEVFDPRVEYRPLKEISHRVEFTGYVARPAKPITRRRSEQPHVLVTVGGGEDGASRILAYLDGLSSTPGEWKTDVITGPLIPTADYKRIRLLARTLGSVKVHRFHPDVPGMLSRSSAVVSMSGYNTTVEILQSACPSVLLPRVFPRTEQLIRADRLARLGLARLLVERKPLALRRAVEEVLAAPPPRSNYPSMDGLTNLSSIAAELLSFPNSLAVLTGTPT
ncbi:MAG TPA: hypothetical protein VEK15_11190 [Vicinamibacteria bacterium]|nr:hypothetical protein [Vicinamibacteria bacterium]